ncbi:MAG: hypothetical protein PHT03_02615 [Bacilli bacterium]|nr:hypothetical protein [Bacilli bacterium]
MSFEKIKICIELEFENDDYYFHLKKLSEKSGKSISECVMQLVIND